MDTFNICRNASHHNHSETSVVSEAVLYTTVTLSTTNSICHAIGFTLLQATHKRYKTTQHSFLIHISLSQLFIKFLCALGSIMFALRYRGFLPNDENIRSVGAIVYTFFLQETLNFGPGSGFLTNRRNKVFLEFS